MAQGSQCEHPTSDGEAGNLARYIHRKPASKWHFQIRPSLPTEVSPWCCLSYHHGSQLLLKGNRRREDGFLRDVSNHADEREMTWILVQKWHEMASGQWQYNQSLKMSSTTVSPWLRASKDHCTGAIMEGPLQEKKLPESHGIWYCRPSLLGTLYLNIITVMQWALKTCASIPYVVSKCK